MANRFSNAEFADIIFVYGFCDGNGRAAKREYERRYPGRRVPSGSTFGRVFQYSREHGRFPGTHVAAGPQRNIERPRVDAQEEILEMAEGNPSTSTRRIGHALGIPHTRAWRALKSERLYPYHLQKVQRLEPNDPAPRLIFCRWIVNHPRNVPRIVFTDEAQFTRDGVTNFRNSHIWANENPHAIVQRNSQHRFSLNVWCGIVDNVLIGPHFFDERLTGELYLNFLRTVVPDLLVAANVNRRGLFFQHDGAPPHFYQQVRQYLDEQFPNRWIGRGGPHAWPPRSPDLTVLDYYLWGHMKQIVYSEEVNTREELRQRIVEASNQIRNDGETIRKAVRHLLVRCRKCIEVGGGHIENLI